MNSRLVLSVLGIVLSSIVYAEQDISQLVEKAVPSTVLITCYNDADQSSIVGSGFVVDSLGDVITNWHVIKEASRIVVKASTGYTVTLNGPIAADTSADLALLPAALPSATCPRLHIRISFPKPGENVIVIGSPLGLSETVSTGIVSAVRLDKGDIPTIQLTAPISHGSSGSAVLDANGRVIGVARSTVVGGQNINFAVPSSLVNALVSHRDDPSLLWHPQPDPHGKAAQRYFTEGQDLLDAGSFAEAAAAFEAAIIANPSDSEAHFWLGVADCKMEVYYQAIEEFKAAISYSTNDEQAASAYALLGQTYSDVHRETDAEASLRHATQLDPSNLYAHYHLGLLLAGQERFGEAETEYWYLKRGGSAWDTEASRVRYLIDEGRKVEDDIRRLRNIR